MEVLRTAAMYERYFQVVQRHAVEVARAEGCSWQEIADAVGISRQGAWERWERRRRGSGAPVTVGNLGEFPVEPPVGPEELFAPMVDAVAESFTAEGDPKRDELVEAGRRALSEAIEGHQRTPKPVPFGVYASWCVRQAMTRRFFELRDQGGGT